MQFWWSETLACAEVEAPAFAGRAVGDIGPERAVDQPAQRQACAGPDADEQRLAVGAAAPIPDLTDIGKCHQLEVAAAADREASLQIGEQIIAALQFARQIAAQSMVVADIEQAGLLELARRRPAA